jgi:Trk K+ transport system NAD-binding subunit
MGLQPDDMFAVKAECDRDHSTPNGDTRIKPNEHVTVFAPKTLPERFVDGFDREPPVSPCLESLSARTAHRSSP